MPLCRSPVASVGGLGRVGAGWSRLDSLPVDFPDAMGSVESLQVKTASIYEGEAFPYAQVPDCIGDQYFSAVCHLGYS